MKCFKHEFCDCYSILPMSLPQVLQATSHWRRQNFSSTPDRQLCSRHFTAKCIKDLSPLMYHVVSRDASITARFLLKRTLPAVALTRANALQSITHPSTKHMTPNELLENLRTLEKTSSCNVVVMRVPRESSISVCLSLHPSLHLSLPPSP